MDRRGVNVLVLSDLWQPFPGGAERLMFNIARDLDRRPEFDVRVLTSYELAAQMDGPPVEFREVGVFTRRAEGAAVIRDALTSSTFRPDVVIVHHLFAYEFDEVLRRSRLPIVQIVLNTRRLAHARLAVYISDHVRAAVPSLGRRGDMTMIPPAFDDVVPDVAVDPCHRPYVGFIKPIEHKGVSLVYDIARHFPGPQRFLILRGEWQTLELIEDLPNVEFMEPVDEISEFYAACRIVLMPSVSEDAGTVAQECALNGIPCISSNVGGLPQTNAGGIRLTSRDPAEWIRAILSLGDQPRYDDVVDRQRAAYDETRRDDQMDELADRIARIVARRR